MASCSEVLPVAGPASAPVVFLCRSARRPLVVRRLHANLQLDATNAFEDALGERALRGEEIAEDADRGEHDGGVEEHGAEDQRLDVAGAIALEVGQRVHGTSAKSPRRIAAVMKTFSGSYCA